MKSTSTKLPSWPMWLTGERLRRIELAVRKAARYDKDVLRAEMLADDAAYLRDAVKIVRRIEKQRAGAA